MAAALLTAETVTLHNLPYVRDIITMRRLLEDILPHNTSFESFEVEHEFKDVGHRTMLLNARRLQTLIRRLDVIRVKIEFAVVGSGRNRIHARIAQQRLEV